MKFLLCLAVTVAAVSSFSAESSNSNQYSAELEVIQQKELNAREQIAKEQAEIQAAKQQLEKLNQRMAILEQEKLKILGTDGQVINAADTMLSNLYKKLQFISSLSSENLSKEKNNIDSLESLYINFKSEKYSRLFRFRDKKNKIEHILNNLKSQTVVQVIESSDSTSEKGVISEVNKDTASEIKKADKYIVKKLKDYRETLFKIAGYPEIYGDSKLWYKIYNANREAIEANYHKFKNTGDFHYSQPQDYLIPGQVLIIPR
jgi:nucleoid-associated protein YgaU